MYVGNTDGIGVYLRKTPAKEDRLKPWPDGTPIKIWPNETKEGDGWSWYKAEDPDGTQGWMPKQYLVETAPRVQPTAAPAAPAATKPPAKP